MNFLMSLLVILTILIGCTGIRAKNSVEVYSEIGYLILFENHEFNYFIPSTVPSRKNAFNDFATQTLDTGFVLTGFDPRLRMQLLREDYTNANISINARVLPVEIKYTFREYAQDRNVSHLNFNFEGNSIDIYYDNKFRTIRDIDVLGKGIK